MFLPKLMKPKVFIPPEWMNKVSVAVWVCGRRCKRSSSILFTKFTRYFKHCAGIFWLLVKSSRRSRFTFIWSHFRLTTLIKILFKRLLSFIPRIDNRSSKSHQYIHEFRSRAATQTRSRLFIIRLLALELKSW